MAYRILATGSTAMSFTFAYFGLIATRHHHLISKAAILERYADAFLLSF